MFYSVLGISLALFCATKMVSAVKNSFQCKTFQWALTFSPLGCCGKACGGPGGEGRTERGGGPAATGGMSTMERGDYMVHKTKSLMELYRIIIASTVWSGEKITKHLLIKYPNKRNQKKKKDKYIQL